MMENTLRGKVALIAGGAGGIGVAHATGRCGAVTCAPVSGDTCPGCAGTARQTTSPPVRPSRVATVG